MDIHPVKPELWVNSAYIWFFCVFIKLDYDDIMQFKYNIALTKKELVMTRQKNYKKTLIACYLGFVTQAISANFTPLLFLTFKNTYGIGLEKISLIPLTFYLTQLLIDFAATKFVDKIGYRICVVSSQVLSAAGLVLMAILPELLPAPFLGILIAVVLYAMGSGLIEVLVSPIVEACPFENKNGMMSSDCVHRYIL